MSQPTLNNQSGFGAPAALMLVAGIITLAVYALQDSTNALKAASGISRSIDRKNIQVILNMVLRDPRSCKSSLLDGDFGSRVTALLGAGGGVSGGDILVRYPRPTALTVTPPDLLAVGKREGAVEIQSVRVTGVKTLPSVPVSYVADLSVGLSSGGLMGAAYTMLIPVYVVADPLNATTLSSCFSSMYVDTDVTFEDQMCSLRDSTKPKYNPSTKSCM